MVANLAGISEAAAPAEVIERILDSMDDGVLVIDRGGTIVTCNAAASQVLGLEASPPAGAGFGDVFLVLEGLDAFTQTMLDAVQGDSDMQRKVVGIEVNGEPRSVAVGTTYLRDGPDGESTSASVVAVFSDITEIVALRETEEQLRRKAEAHLVEIAEAYRAIESRNETLAAAVRKARIARFIAAGAIVAVLAMLGGWAWQTDANVTDLIQFGSDDPVAGPDAPATWTVAASTVRQTISIIGRIGPGQITRVLSPAGGTVRAIHFRYGDEVEEGARLVELDLSAALREYRSVRGQYLDVRQRVEALEDWENGREMAAARRQLGRAKDALEMQRRRVEQTTYLLEEGVIAAAEHEAAVETLARLGEDHAAAEREIEVVRERANADARERADLEYRNLREQLETLEAVLNASVVLAPVGGVVMVPDSGEPGARTGGTRDGRLLEGVSVSDGQALVQIADTGTLSVEAVVEEVEVTKLRIGQPVRVTGDAFPGIELEGELVEVASHASSTSQGVSARFPVRARIGAPTPEQRQALRIGMSVDLHILVRDDHDVLTVPLDAVERTGNGLTVRVLDPATGEIREVPVEAGTTTPNAVEIVTGLNTGDQVMLPSR